MTHPLDRGGKLVIGTWGPDYWQFPDGHTEPVSYPDEPKDEWPQFPLVDDADYFTGKGE
jgi:hypothetical protein